MSEDTPTPIDLNTAPITMEQFSSNIQNDILAYVECECGSRSFLPASVCYKCKDVSKKYSSWKKVDWEGNILTFSITYVPPPDLADISPYASIIVSFGEGLNISAILSAKINPFKPPLDLIGKKIVPDFIQRPNGKKILGMKVIE
jgi:uncharacterized OB-fold protein